jgi:hypothetical protein
MVLTVPAHKVVGDTGKPGQVLNFPLRTVKMHTAEWWTRASAAIVSQRMRWGCALDIDLTKLEHDADDARRLRLLYDTLFYNPVDRGI